MLKSWKAMLTETHRFRESVRVFIHHPSLMCCRAIFDRIDANNDGTVDFNELLVVLVLVSRLNSLESRLAFAFDMWVSDRRQDRLWDALFVSRWDGSGDGYIQREELSDVLSAMVSVWFSRRRHVSSCSSVQSCRCLRSQEWTRSEETS